MYAMKKQISLFLTVAFFFLGMINGRETSASAAPLAKSPLTPSQLFQAALNPSEDLSRDYFLKSGFFPINACDSPPIQHDQQITLRGNRKLLVTSWMPEGVYENNTERIPDLVRWADQSTCSFTPLKSKCTGLMGAGYNTSPQHKEWGWADLVVVTSRLLLWFDSTSAHPLSATYNAIPNGGGGQLRGVWKLDLDKEKHLIFSDMRNKDSWAPNMLLPGATPTIQGSGLSGFISATSEDNGITYNLEGDANAVISVHAPSSTLPADSTEPGIMRSNGFTVQILGHFVDVRPQKDHYLVGDSKTQGHIEAITSYQIAACDDLVYLDSIWRNETTHPIGPVVNINWATNVHGEPNPDTDHRNANLIDFDNTAPETCIVRTRYADSQGCHTGRVDFNSLAGHEHEYLSRPNLFVTPPSMTLRGVDSEGKATSWTFGIHPLSGIMSLGVIFDLHSNCVKGGKCLLVVAHDATIFNKIFWESKDPRIRIQDWERLPQGIERVTIGNIHEYFIRSQGELRSRQVMQFGP